MVEAMDHLRLDYIILYKRFVFLASTTMPYLGQKGPWISTIYVEPGVAVMEGGVHKEEMLYDQFILRWFLIYMNTYMKGAVQWVWPLVSLMT